MLSADGQVRLAEVGRGHVLQEPGDGVVDGGGGGSQEVMDQSFLGGLLRA